MEQTESSSKLPDTKAVLAFLAETFPQCFTLKGEAKPLKIGIFQDLAERLDSDERVSKTQLRMALRHYTNAWRYLRSVKAGVARVDLDGADSIAVTDSEAEHAQTSLHESMRKAGVDPDKKPQRKPNDKKAPRKPAASAKPKPRQAPRLDINALKVGDDVRVVGGQRPLPGTVVAVDKDSVQVQLVTGMVMHVKGEHLIAAKGE
ncbi:RNA chaperone ProQ [Gallaecimonas pentaromativorans]|uniref:RNA chaperone ProQ n=1 Tax=Gallaecimonas pentaromativorans TaxID=584787 RepID=A0A3N1P6B0_9GAMM|nr:RNA chaperone ProQ [Gallaecimonas pentaromativorans]MED5525399.1 RNA chaperone ProQ [Pseudomonadota bacterium]ROQ27544.1 ProP effector [Gallaecimonas pentaromativorans]